MSRIPREIALTDDEISALLASCWIMRVATLGPSGRLNLTPIWFASVDGAIYAYCRGQKVVNMRRDPSVTVLVDRNERFPELQGVMIEAAATVLEDDAAEGADPRLGEARRRMGEKYASGRDDMPDSERGRPVTRSAEGRTRRWVRFDPIRVVSWDNTKIDRVRPRAAG